MQLAAGATLGRRAAPGGAAAAQSAEIWRWDAVEIADAIRLSQISSVEAVGSCLDRIAAVVATARQRQLGPALEVRLQRPLSTRQPSAAFHRARPQCLSKTAVPTVTASSSPSTAAT